MIHRPLPYEPTPEHRLTHAKWARGFGIVYVTILLLLLAIVTAQRSGTGPDGATAIAKAPAATAPRTANRSSHAHWE